MRSCAVREFPGLGCVPWTNNLTELKGFVIEVASPMLFVENCLLMLHINCCWYESVGSSFIRLLKISDRYLITYLISNNL